jgi:hypothetical protein
MAAIVLGCGPGGTHVPFRVVTLGDDPFFATTATAIAVTVERDGVRDDASTTRFSPRERALTMPPMPFGSGYALIVETELTGLVLARGRSFPFAVTAAGADHTPDVSLGVLGRYGATASGDPTDAYVVATASDSGALLASPRGLTRFVAHGSDARPLLATRVDWPAERVGGDFAPLGDAMLVVGGVAPGASLVSAEGAVLGELPATAISVRQGVALVALDASTVIAIGGARADGTLAPDVTRIEWDGAMLGASALAPLPSPRSGAQALLLSAHAEAGIEARVLVHDGTTAVGPAGDVVLLDPAGHAAPSATVLGIPLSGAAACALDTGLVLVAGGRDTSGVSGQVSILVVQPDAIAPIPTVSVLSPAPPRGLFRPRERAVAIAIASGLALVLGGLDGAGQPVAESEIAEVHFDSLPGSVVLTSSVPTPGRVTAATRMRDHTVLVSSDGSLFSYFPPRGE